MKIRVLADRAVIVSEVAFADMEKIAKYEPDALKIKDKEGNETFVVMVGKKDSVAACGVCFIEEGDKAIARIDLPIGEEKKADYVAENYGIIMGKVNTLEDQMKTALAGVDATIAQIKAGIEVMEYDDAPCTCDTECVCDAE